MYGLKTVGAILQGFAVLGMVLGFAAGLLALTSPLARDMAIPWIVTSIAGGLSGLIVGGMAQAVADIAENAREQRRMLMELTRRQAEAQTKSTVLRRMEQGRG